MTKDKFYKIVDYLKGVIKGTEFENHCFVVGGAVRDLVMENEIKDVDLVLDINGGGIRFAEWMEANGYTKGSVVTYPTYGTAMFKLKEFEDIEIECVQTRKEQYKDKNSRNPETEYGTILEDALRRDLTINALYWGISNEAIIDPTTKGIKDIMEHRIRVTSDPNIVFSDDPLRMMRVIRFSCRFGWDIEEETFQGIVLNAKRLSIITKERISDELNKILITKNAVNGIYMLMQTNLCLNIIPELYEMEDMQQNKYHIGDVLTHSLAVLDLVVRRPYWGSSNLITRMAALLHDIGKIKVRTIDENGNIHFYKHELASVELVETILKRLKYSNDFIEKVKFLVKNHMRTKQWGDNCEHMKDKTLRKLQYECGYAKFFALMTLIDADNKSHAEGYCLPHQVYMISRRCNQMVDEGTDMFDYKLPIDGNDVMEIKGIQPGKDVRKCLDYAMKLAYNNPKMDRELMLKHIKGYKL